MAPTMSASRRGDGRSKPSGNSTSSTHSAWTGAICSGGGSLNLSDERPYPVMQPVANSIRLAAQAPPRVHQPGVLTIEE